LEAARRSKAKAQDDSCFDEARDCGKFVSFVSFASLASLVSVVKRYGIL
jgi:hypothetical protein